MKNLLKGVLYTWTVLAVIVLTLGFVQFTTNGFDNIQKDIAKVNEKTDKAHILAQDASLKITLDDKISSVLESNKHRVVYIEITPNDKWKARAEKFGVQDGTGTGWFVEVNDEFAYVATNHHVVEQALNHPEVFDVNVLEYNSPWSFPAKIVGYDKISDIAVLKIEKVLGTEDWESIKWANHDNTMAGETVVAIGHGMSLPWSMTSGTITALDRWMIRPYNLMIQSDTVVNPGNSGGPLLNLDGEVVGVVDALLDPGQAVTGKAAYAGVSLMIAGFQAEKAINEIIETGKVSYPYIEFGLANPSRDEYVEAFGSTPDGSYVIVSNVEDGSNAAAAGFKKGDFLVSVNDTKLRGMISLIKYVLSHKPGDTVEFEVLRDGETITLPYTLEDLQEHDPNIFS